MVKIEVIEYTDVSRDRYIALAAAFFLFAQILSAFAKR